jgi:hypothetical protein
MKTKKHLSQGSRCVGRDSNQASPTYTTTRWSRDSVVGIATGYELEERESSGRVKSFLFSTLFRPALGSIQPPIQRVPGALSAGVKRPEREADHSPPTSADLNETWIYACAPPYVFMAQCLLS